MILYEALSGSLPFAGDTPAETVMRRLVRPPPPLAKARPDLPAWLPAFVGRLLKLTPAHRFASADEALRVLEQQRVPRSPQSWRRWLIAALAVVAAAGVFELGRRQLSHWLAPTPAAASVPHIAVLPLQVDPADAALAATARAIEEHARQWLRGDTGRAVAEA